MAGSEVRVRTEQEWRDFIRERERNRMLTDSDLEQLDAALEEHPDSAGLWCLRGDVILLSDTVGDRWPPQEALRSYQRAVELCPEGAEAHEEIGHYFDSLDDDPGSAEPWLRKAIELGAGATAWASLARVLAELGRGDEALALIAPASCPFADDVRIAEIREEIEQGDWSPLGSDE